MNTSRKYQPTLKVKNIGMYSESKKELENHTFICTPEGFFYLDNGKRVPAKVFENNYPIIELQRSAIDKGQKLDGRSKWID